MTETLFHNHSQLLPSLKRCHSKTHFALYSSTAVIVGDSISSLKVEQNAFHSPFTSQTAPLCRFFFQIKFLISSLTSNSSTVYNADFIFHENILILQIRVFSFSFIGFVHLYCTKKSEPIFFGIHGEIPWKKKKCITNMIGDQVPIKMWTSNQSMQISKTSRHSILRSIFTFAALRSFSILLQAIQCRTITHGIYHIFPTCETHSTRSPEYETLQRREPTLSSAAQQQQRLFALYDGGTVAGVKGESEIGIARGWSFIWNTRDVYCPTRAGRRVPRRAIRSRQTRWFSNTRGGMHYSDFWIWLRGSRVILNDSLEFIYDGLLE